MHRQVARVGGCCLGLNSVGMILLYAFRETAEEQESLLLYWFQCGEKEGVGRYVKRKQTRTSRVKKKPIEVLLCTRVCGALVGAFFCVRVENKYLRRLPDFGRFGRFSMLYVHIYMCTLECACS